MHKRSFIFNFSAMKKLLVQLTYFFIPIFIFILIIEICFRIAPTTYALKKDNLLKNKSKIEILILGNSQAAYGINPDFIDLYSFNIANVSQSLYFDKRITLKHIEQLPKLKYILINLEFHSLSFSSQKARDYWSYYDFDIEYKNDMSIFTKTYRTLGYTPTVLLSYAIKRSKKDNICIDFDSPYTFINNKEKGSLLFDGPEVDAFKIKTLQNTLNDFQKTITLSKEKVEVMADLNDFIAQLKLKNITPILITTPVYKTYFNLYNKKLLTDFNKSVFAIANKNKLEYWNYLNLDLQESDFLNGNHLNKVGAAKYSKILNKRINELQVAANTKI